MTSPEKDEYTRALKLFIDSVIKPDYDLRQQANYDGCYEELMEIRQHCLTYLQSLKEIHNIDLPDESDEIEAEKVRLEKIASRDLSFSRNELMYDNYENKFILFIPPHVAEFVEMHQLYSSSLDIRLDRKYNYAN